MHTKKAIKIGKNIVKSNKKWGKVGENGAKVVKKCAIVKSS
jgi:hypothetical protein